MLVIVSDLHLTDGSSGTTIDANAFRIFRYRLKDLAYAASWRQGHVYKPIDEFHLVLLGDVFDVIRSVQWLRDTGEGLVRPWDDPNDSRYVKRIEAITKGIIERNANSLKTLRDMAVNGDIVLPDNPVSSPAELHSPAGSTPGVRMSPVKVHIHYQVGNHDWFYHLAGSGYDAIRQDVRAAIGLANDPARPFPHAPDESPELRSVYDQHRVWARHGDIYDNLNYDGNRDKSSLGDGIVIDLLTRFPDEVASRLGDILPKQVLESLKEIDNVRPLGRIPDWIDGVLRRTCADDKQVKQVKKVWDTVANDFAGSSFVRRTYGFMTAALLRSTLMFTKTVSIHAMSVLANTLGKRVLEEEGSFYPNALQEQMFRNRTAKFIVYGHTHRQEIVPLDVSVQSGEVLTQSYINTGTWRRTYEMAVGKPTEQEFMGYNVMTYAAFFRGDERNGRPFETWSGTLGVDDAV